MATHKKGTYNFEYVPFIVCAFGLLLCCENIVAVQCFVYQFGFRASRKRTEQVEPVVCAFTDGDADSNSFFFLLVHNFFCAFGLLFEMNVVPLCRLEQVCYSHTTTCLVFMLGAFRSQFFCAYGFMRRLPLHLHFSSVPHDFLHHRGILPLSYSSYTSHRAIHYQISYLQSLMETLHTH